MATYICLFRWTPKGLENVKNTPARVDAARKMWQSVGVTLKDFYMLTGHYDTIAILEAADDNAIAKAMLGTAATGAVHTETMRAFTDSEFRSICGSL